MLTRNSARILATTALALALAAPALAQQQDQRSTTRQQQHDRASRQDTDDRPTSQLTLADAATLKGSKINNAHGDGVGEIEDLVVDVKKGQVAYAIIGVGGFLGVGEKSVAVPWDHLKAGNQPQTFVLNADRQTLESAPAVDKSNLAQLDDPQSRRQIAAFWKRAESQQAQAPKGQRHERPATPPQDR